jgi:hydroxypyruvate reductase
MNQRPVLLQALPLLPSLERQLAETYTVHRLPPAGPERDAFLAARGGEFEGLVTSAAGGATAELIEALPNLRVISSFGVGLDQIAVPAAARRGIPVGYTPDVLNDCVACWPAAAAFPKATVSCAPAAGNRSRPRPFPWAAG